MATKPKKYRIINNSSYPVALNISEKKERRRLELRTIDGQAQPVEVIEEIDSHGTLYLAAKQEAPDNQVIVDHATYSELILSSETRSGMVTKMLEQHLLIASEVK